MSGCSIELTAQRLDQLHAAAVGCWLGGAAYGERALVIRQLADGLGAAASACAVIDMQPLAAAHGFAELWRVTGHGPQRAGRAGADRAVRWSADDALLFAHVSVDEAALGDGTKCALEPAAHRAYSELFCLLDAHGYAHPIRFWNYLPRINVDEDGLERYRHFNVGRHAAFVEARRPPDAAPPAACALGCGGGALTVMVLAARHPSIAIENPRQVSAYRYPAQYGPRPPAFSRAALYRDGAQALLAVSGTASIVGHETLHIGDVAAQVDESLRNVQAVIDAANDVLGTSLFTLPGLKLKGYVRRAADAARVRHQLALRLPDASIPLVRADICRANLLFEIEGATSAVVNDRVGR